MLDRELARAQMRAYRERWESVAAEELVEQRLASLPTRWRQLNALVRLSQQLQLVTEGDGELLTSVRERWRRLKNLQP
jgi:hypothetical protein